MKPATFDYVAPHTVHETLDALGDTERDVRVLAGGQSLILEMHLQRIRPDLVVDINRVAGLDHLNLDNGAVRVGALVRHGVFESPQAVPGPLGRLFALAVVNIAHPPIRARGTMVGSLAWAHPASEWCAIALALDAAIEVRSADRAREIAVHDYFRGALQTARARDELITSVRFPLLGDNTGVGFIEHRRTHFCFAQVAVATALAVHDGVIEQARIGLVNCADRPVRARAAEQALVGAEVGSPGTGYRLPDGHPFIRAGRIAAEQDAAPLAEPYADPEYRRNAIAVLVGRTLRQAATDYQVQAGNGATGGRL
ncbi:FAD binding domain-containing protein [Microtetraspora sp. NBRC 16547]|uniref:FAD binding domain-containing protein n=1 Tax=Microtetraspora sp. NBRC 16547 TaxID=3030993 RepID=UPI0024A58BA0|nr:FAD binding domain-containing protein [Microtetraspora sp. NBRC 16547]GLW99899.1 carbon-monoxide dehydrogenase medium subunit [Microtetraspora sp. NBRC 16547]